VGSLHLNSPWAVVLSHISISYEVNVRESLIEAEASQPQWQGFLGGGSMAGVFHLNQEGCYKAKVWQSI